MREERCEKTHERRSERWGGGGGQAAIALEIANRQELCAGQNNIRRFARTPAIAKTMVFNVKKLLNDGVDVTLRRHFH